ncbi:MarR family winged helix-turn-helix transcriptional regulator [Staphylococcus intermedius]|uniref:MarR family transcriptional regulator n=1 Tax=Staphylococcus intermedius NCTC 11048 TaxID=1141106 RepID=A0A380G4E1_STAIN|nr:MarR family transcriptional regulator [Staphylococcus intermedius]PCF63708.1 MarR family transcriptional regulator [Staphylococcus intermedius]PCF78423.1 MarR family transcriptional regulator [Staphylococcus intermedius]PCF79397.1 MarR family transcriptional regulator [Staphylococcus intermedius]PCF86867.1 MarR family transcriptional regulator [Staphylococcus intermedius]PCF89947.1 MarR family transcriptional regulator [Staphylococcus intermedius]
MEPSILFDHFTKLYRPYIKLVHPLLDENELYPAQWLVMKDIAVNPGTTLVQISKRRSIEKPTTRKILKALDAQGWLIIRPGEVDKREKLLFLSESGHTVHDKLKLQIGKLQRQAIEPLQLSDNEIARATDILEQLYQSLLAQLQNDES